jgi:superfamily I DNA and RNA helicase
VVNKSSRGAKLQQLEAQIATLDPRQSAAVLETIDGVQRIRGLAGSGKTIVLALKAAYLHTQHPDWRIAVTYNSRSLHDQFRRLINGFVIEQAGIEPDWKQLRIVNAWGGRGEEHPGLYYEFCQTHGVDAYNFRAAQIKFGRDQAFAGACAEALQVVENVDQAYDAILIDEAQDLPASFLRMCYEFLRGKHRLVYAYDELQNLSHESLPSAQEIFGTDKYGDPVVDFDKPTAPNSPRADVILEKCYRNSRPVLVTAHALGFGVYREQDDSAGTSLVQMFDKPDLWTEIGYRVVQGSLEPGSTVLLERTPAASPEFLENHSPVEDLIEFHSFGSAPDQNNWIVEQIVQNLTHDELRHEDIIVINPNPLTTRSNVGSIRQALAERGIQSHLAGVDTASDEFFARERNSITFTGVFRAKGNEAGMVYVINSEEGLGTRTNLALVRNRLFTAITRSKAWVRVTGVGMFMSNLESEFVKTANANYRLHFDYPTEKQREALRILHHETNSDDDDNINLGNKSARELVQGLKSGKIYAMDLDPEVRAALLKALEE